MPELAVCGLGKRYGDRWVIRGLDFVLEAGGRLGVVGPSGAGKTTLLRILAGLDLPDEGTVAEAGRVVCAPGGAVAPWRRGIGMLFQDLALWPHLTVEAHAELALRASGVPRRSLREEAHRLLGSVGLQEKTGAYPSALSGGERQRVAWVRAIASRPRLLILDEPLTSLDPALREELLRRTEAYVVERQTTLVLASHDPSAVSRLTECVVELGP